MSDNLTKAIDNRTQVLAKGEVPRWTDADVDLRTLQHLKDVLATITAENAPFDDKARDLRNLILAKITLIVGRIK